MWQFIKLRTGYKLRQFLSSKTGSHPPFTKNHVSASNCSLQKRRPRRLVCRQNRLCQSRCEPEGMHAVLTYGNPPAVKVHCRTVPCFVSSAATFREIYIYGGVQKLDQNLFEHDYIRHVSTHLGSRWSSRSVLRTHWGRNIYYVAALSVANVLFRVHILSYRGNAVAQLVQTPLYKQKGRGFDSRWYRWNYSSCKSIKLSSEYFKPF